MSDTKSPIFLSPNNDKEMEEAGAKARQSFRIFWREIAWERRRIIPGLDVTAFKASFSDPPEMRAKNPDGLEVEHMWLSDVDFDGKVISGTLLNEPNSLQSIHEGDRVRLGGKQLCDWLYVIQGQAYGGFTIDVLRSRMSPKERRAHDQAWGIEFGQAGTVQLVPEGYLSDEAPKKKGLFSFLGKPATKPQDLASVMAKEHPMSINMRDSLIQTFKDHPNFLHETNDNGETFLHQLALAGSFDGVDVCLNMGADPKCLSKNGMTPYALAKVLGWTKILERFHQAGVEK